MLRPAPALLGYTLADYLKPDLGPDVPISNKLVDEVLRSIPLEADEAGFKVDADGTYSVGIVEGHAPNEGSAKYIGKSSRMRYQKKKIREIEDNLEKLQMDRIELAKQKQAIEEEIRQTDEWKQAMPADEQLNEVYVQLEKTGHQLEEQKKILFQLDENWKKAHRELQQVRLELHQQGSMLNIPLTKEAVIQTISK